MNVYENISNLGTVAYRRYFSFFFFSFVCLFDPHVELEKTSYFSHPVILHFNSSSSIKMYIVQALLYIVFEHVFYQLGS